MTVTLAVETSSISYGVAVSDGSTTTGVLVRRRDEPGFAGLGAVAVELLDSLGLGFTDLRLLAVDVGPGNLGSVRAGVAYVNGLAFSLDVPVVSADALTLLASALDGEPVLALRNAGGGLVFAGMFGPGRAARFGYGPPAEVVPGLLDGLDAVTVAGVLRGQVAALAPDVVVKDSGVEHPDVTAVSRYAAADGLPRAAFATPLSETSTIFQER